MTQGIDLTSRRELLRLSLFGATGLLAAAVPARLLAADRTPPQTEGPFHPTAVVGGVVVDERIAPVLDRNTDLTKVDGQPGTALGQILYVRGTVEDKDGHPVPDATVEIWQACA